MQDEVRFHFGVDLGGTKIELLAIDLAGHEVFRKRIATPQGDYAGTVESIARLVEEAERLLGGTGTVGVGIPGAENSLDRIKNANSTCLIGHPLRQDLGKRLNRPIRLANDANCFALSEATDGAGAGAQSVFGVILGTGVGGGIVFNGQVLTGANRIAGEWGHNPLPYPEEESLVAPSCYCGRSGCVEAWLSGPAMAAEFLRVTGRTYMPAEMVAAAKLGDSDCEAALLRYERRLAKSLAVVINILDPDVIVLGGGLSNLDRLYENVPKSWPSYVFSDEIRTRLVPNVHGDSSGVRGAAWLWR